MAETVSDALLARLTEWNVKRIYGYPGDGINGILGALDSAMDRFEFVQVRQGFSGVMLRGSGVA